MGKIDINPFLKVLTKLIEIDVDNPPAMLPAAAAPGVGPFDHFGFQDIDMASVDNRHFSVAKLLIKVADKIYTSAGGSGDATDLESTGNPGWLQSHLENAETPFGVAVSKMVEGILMGLTLREVYDFDWTLDVDRFMRERLGFLDDLMNPNYMGSDLENDSAISEIRAALKGYYPPPAPQGEIQVQALPEDDLMERWSRLAGIRR